MVIAVGCILWMICGSVLAHDPGYTIEDIGILPGDVRSGATAINRLGEAVGWSENVNGDRRAIYWHDGVLEELSTPLGVVSASAFGINDAGVIVGSVIFSDLSERAAMWENGQFVDLTDFAPLSDGVSHGVSQAGVIVGSAFVNVLGEDRAMAWNDGVPSVVGTLVGNSAALDINESDQIVGWAEDATGARHAFLADTGTGTFNDLGLLPNGIWSEATAINENGTVVGYAAVGGEDDGVFAFEWTAQSGILENLGTLGTNQSQAFDINAADFIVGSSPLVGTGQVNAVLWRPDRMINLNSLLLPGSDWDYLIEANGINDEGQIVGRGIINGEIHAFVLEPVIGMVAPTPGDSGVVNTFDAAGATPGNRVIFVYGLAWGQTDVPGCAGKILNIENPKLLRSVNADSVGHAIFDMMVPQSAKNVAVIFQVFEPDTCEVSVPISWTFH